MCLYVFQKSSELELELFRSSAIDVINEFLAFIMAFENSSFAISRLFRLALSSLTLNIFGLH